MRNTNLLASGLLALSLTGCVGDAQGPLGGIAPFTRVSSEASGDHWYQLGRHYQDQGAYGKAEQAFRKALQTESGNAEVFNALGAVLAAQGRLEEATEAFGFAAQTAPEAAHIRSNLGRIYLLRGMKDEALAHLQQAAQLPGASQRVRDNLAEAQAALKPQLQASTTVSAGNSSQTSPPAAVRVPISVLGGNAVVAQVATSSPQPIDLASAVHPSSPFGPIPVAILDIPVRPSASTAAETKSLDASLAGQAERRFRLEVANGNGINGMARRVSIALRTHGYFQTRLTNQKPFTQAKTQVFYREGFAAQAQTVGRGFKQTIAVSQRSNIDSRADVRIVLGHDLPRDFALNLESPPASFLLAAAILPSR